jgi:Fic family protein
LVPTTNPLLCAEERKAELEARNAIHQLDYIAWAVNKMAAAQLSEGHILELHRIAVHEIYPCAGEYRTVIRQIRMDGSRHVPPEAWRVSSLIQDMLHRARDIQSVLVRAAYVLWRFNWIHPFAGGNGRTARALSYLVICMEHGAALPGVPSMPRLIFEDSAGRYTRGLREADAAEGDGREDLGTLLSLVGDSAIAQAMSALKQQVRNDLPRTGG